MDNRHCNHFFLTIDDLISFNEKAMFTIFWKVNSIAHSTLMAQTEEISTV